MARARRQKNGLTEKEMSFAREIASGKEPSQALRDSNYCTSGMTKATIAIEANKLLHRPNISLMITELHAQAEEQATLKRKDRMALLTEFALDDNIAITNRLKAIDLLNKMCGDYSETVRNEFTGAVDVRAVRRNILSSLLNEIGLSIPLY